jgi:hypothetical protein
MPVIVDEIVISVEVGGAGSRGAAPASGGGGPDEEHRALISECVERVLDVLAMKEER